MDKLLSVAGGQKLRVEDWALIQDQAKMGFDAAIKSLIGSYTSCILSGVKRQIIPDHFFFPEGYVYIRGEIYHVPEATLSNNRDNFFFLQPVITTTESRTFKDEDTHDVYELRSMEVVESDVMGEDGIEVGELSTLQEILENDILSKVPGGDAPLVKFISKSYDPFDHLDTTKELIPAPDGGGEEDVKINQVISCLAKIRVTTKLEVGSQQLNVAYGTDATAPDIGYFRNSFLESSPGVAYQRMIVGDTYAIPNSRVCVGFSAEASPSVGGDAVITLFCFYTVIDVS